MTTTPTQPPPLNGQHLAVAARATRVLLDDILDETGTGFLPWIALNGVATGGGTVDREPLVARFAEALVSDEAPVRAAFDELESDGLLRRVAGEPALDAVIVELTPTGAALQQTIQQRIGRLIAELYGGLSHDDLATAARVLTEVTERARAMRRRSTATHGR